MLLKFDAAASKESQFKSLTFSSLHVAHVDIAFTARAIKNREIMHIVQRKEDRISLLCHAETSRSDPVISSALAIFIISAFKVVLSAY